MMNNEDSNYGGRRDHVATETGPSEFDRVMGSLQGLPDVVHTQPSTVRVVPPLGIGGVQLFVIQTYRQRETGDTIFLEHVSNGVATRIVLPPKVSNIINKQRDALTGKTRSKAAKAVAQARADRGEVPGFMRGKKKAAGK
jgi:hypothetical protein